MMFPILNSKRLKMRQLEIDDYIDLFEIFSSEDNMKYYGMAAYKTKDQAKELVMNFNKGYEAKKSIRWGIELLSEHKIIGTCGFHNWQKNHLKAEIGYDINKAYQRKGYVTEAVEVILDYGFKDLLLNRIEAVVYPENIPSHCSLKKLGFISEGLLRDFMVFKNKPQDLVMYRLLSTDFNKAT